VAKPVDHDHLKHTMDNLLAVARARSGLTWSRITVPETNSPNPSCRPEWFTSVADWLANDGGRRMLSFWQEDGPLSGPWLPITRRYAR
jgi:hypothetical protein